MSDENERYGINRNLWRRVYGKTRKKPRVTQYFDSGSQQTVSRDLQRTYRHRDFYEIDGVNRRANLFDLPEIASGGDYQEGLISFNGETELTVNFSQSFNGTPYVVYTPEPDVGDPDINVFGTALPTTTQMFIGLSAPYFGNVRYRAVWSNTWPIVVTEPGSGSFTVYAGAVDVTNATSYTASYALDPGTIEFRASFHDSLSNDEANVGLLLDASSSTSATTSLTAPSSGKIHFIAAKL